MNKRLYKNIISDISKSLRYLLNEMARKPVNRTIDKKLWLTVSSIISRNRSTEAENVNPIGSDKNNLLQRYVASLLIMKKPCPTTIEDISKLKTFKKIGYKFIDLGGTILEIQKLYNENKGENNNISTTSNTSLNNEVPSDNSMLNNVHDNNIDNTENDDYTSDFWDKFDSDDDDNDSFFSDVEMDDDYTTDKISSITSTVTNENDIIQILSEYTGIHDKPRGFKLVKSNNSNEYQKLVYNQISDRQLAGANCAGELYKNNWKIYINPVYEKNFDSQLLDHLNEISKSVYAASSNIYSIKNLPIHITPDCNTQTQLINQLTNIFKKEYHIHIKTFNKLVPDINSILTIYNNIDSSIDNKVISKLFKSDSYISSAIISPDNGLMMYRRIKIYDIIDIKSLDKSTLIKPWLTVNQEHIRNYFKLQGINLPTDDYYAATYNNSICIIYTFEYILTFTGEKNYYESTKDNIKSEFYLNQKDFKIKQRQFTIFKKLKKEYAENITDIVKYNWYKDINSFGKIGNTYGIRLPLNMYDPGNKKKNMVNYFWNRQRTVNFRDPYQENIVGTSITHKQTYTAVKNITDPNVVCAFKPVNDTFIAKEYKPSLNGEKMVEITLLPKGLQLFKEICNAKKIPY